MTGSQTRQYEMLVRVSQFGEAHRDRFPDTTAVGQAFAVVADVVTQLTSYADAKSKTAEEGKEAKAIARQALLDRLRLISHAARAISRQTPGFAAGFKMPQGSKPTDQAVLGAGRVFVDNAEAAKTRFVDFGVPEAFIADLKGMVDRFDQAIQTREHGREQRSVALKGLRAALATGLEAVRGLDTIVAIQLGGDRDALAAWEHDRRIESPRRKRGTKEEPAVSAAPTTSPSSPAPTAAAAPVPTTPAPGTTVPVAGEPSEAGPAAGKAA